MKSHFPFFALAAAASIVFGAGCQSSTPSMDPTGIDGIETSATSIERPDVVGGDRDEHGCIGSAGYQWCEAKNKCLRIWEEQCLSDRLRAATTTILLSTADSLKYCNGADMDSEGFRKTITKNETIVLPDTDRTDEERVRSILKQVAGDSCKTFVDQVEFSIEKDKIVFTPLNAWAGISITMCSCKPLIEENLLLIPGIKEVVWK